MIIFMLLRLLRDGLSLIFDMAFMFALLVLVMN